MRNSGSLLLCCEDVGYSSDSLASCYYRTTLPMLSGFRFLFSFFYFCVWLRAVDCASGVCELFISDRIVWYRCVRSHMSGSVESTAACLCLPLGRLSVCPSVRPFESMCSSVSPISEYISTWAFPCALQCM